MSITLVKAQRDDCPLIYYMQIKSFRALLEKYQDYDFSPGAEKIERTYQRFDEPTSDFWLICSENKPIGAVRIGHYDSLCKLKQIFILPEHQEHGFAQEAIRLVEAQYPDATRWELATILQEDKLRHLYEKMGYSDTGKRQPLQEGMDIIIYAK